MAHAYPTPTLLFPTISQKCQHENAHRIVVITNGMLIVLWYLCIGCEECREEDESEVSEPFLVRLLERQLQLRYESADLLLNPWAWACAAFHYCLPLRKRERERKKSFSK